MKFNCLKFYSLAVLALNVKAAVIKNSGTKKVLARSININDDTLPTKNPIYIYSSECDYDTSFFHDEEKFVCVDKKVLNGFTSNIDYLYFNRAIFYNDDNHTIRPLREGKYVCRDNVSSISQCYKGTAEILNKDILFLLPRPIHRNFTIVSSKVIYSEPAEPADDSRLTKNLELSNDSRSSDSIMREYFCGTEYFHSSKDKDACLRPFIGNLSDNINAMSNKHLVVYEGKLLYLVNVYSNICEDQSTDECYQSIAEILGKEVNAIRPNDENINDVSYITSPEESIYMNDDIYYSNNSIYAKKVNWNNIVEVIDRYNCTSLYYKSGTKHVCLKQYGRELPTNMTMNEIMDKKFVLNNGVYYYVLDELSSLDVQWSDTIKNYENIAELMQSDLDLILPIANLSN